VTSKCKGKITFLLNKQKYDYLQEATASRINLTITQMKHCEHRNISWETCMITNTGVLINDV